MPFGFELPRGFSAHGRYPHITSLFLNAGMLVPKSNLYFKFMFDCIKDGLVATVTDPHIQTEHVGVKSADGERGMMWGVNVLAPYIVVSDFAMGTR